MRIVIDTNVLMAGLLKDSAVRKILVLSGNEFFLPEFAIEEIKKYEDELLEKSGYDRKEFKLIVNNLLENLRIVPKDRIKESMLEGEEIMKTIDIKDSSFIACALAIDADGLWSFDKYFKKQKRIRVFDIKELV
ncbi:hypothetical protein CO038_03290 [Candidatus Pacearchaeota archaeon CG_4_9_14_0_2_um_filter_39_13]|nr:MAG: hypothetical protein CO038_03290 [Candidatus Pacearchaeota archaeon CG_4_9_14_0_2_um_filter_39_13]